MAFKLDFDELPNSGIKKLYKFKSFDQDGYYKDLLNNQLWLSSRTELNDPLDCRVKLNYKLCSDEEIKNIMRSHLSWIPFNSIINLIVDAQFNHRKNNIEDYLNSFESAIDKSIGVFSLTQEISESMWDKYSNKHPGFYVEFNAVKLFSELNQKFEQTGNRIFIFRVRYEDVLPEVNPCKASLDEKAQMFLIKTKAWEYEKEWRIVWFDGMRRDERKEKDYRKEPITANCISNIYFGLNASKENIDTAIKILSTSNPGIGIFKALKKKDEFGLDFEKIA